MKITKLIRRIFSQFKTSGSTVDNKVSIEEQKCEICEKAKESNLPWQVDNIAANLRKKTCETCGKVVHEQLKVTEVVKICSFCNGFGLWHVPTDGYLSGNAMNSHQDDCPNCNGHGKVMVKERGWTLVNAY